MLSRYVKVFQRKTTPTLKLTRRRKEVRKMTSFEIIDFEIHPYPGMSGWMAVDGIAEYDGITVKNKTVIVPCIEVAE